MIYQYRTAVPTSAQWRAGVAYLPRIEGVDGLTWAPYWAEEGTPLFRGLNAFETPSMKTADFANFDVVWVFTSHGVDLSDLPQHLLASVRWSDGPLTLWRVENRGERVVADLYLNLPKTVCAVVFQRSAITGQVRVGTACLKHSAPLLSAV